MKNEIQKNNVENEENLKKIEYFNAKRRHDGTIYRSKRDMLKSYEESYLPYPFGAIWRLDYCWNIVITHIKNNLVFALPLSLTFSYAFNPKIRTKGLRSVPISYYISIYAISYSVLISIFLFDSIFFCDYCKPWSDVYSMEGRQEKYKEILKTKIIKEQNSSDIKYKKTKNKGLSDDEL